jgi:hypothetical protein
MALMAVEGEAITPESKARRLLCEILPERALKEFLEKDYFHHYEKLGVDRISRDSQTEIYRKGRLAASGCLQLTIFAPSYDRMIAEYLILANDEQLYWTKANIFPARPIIDFRVLAVAALDVTLVLKLVLDYIY